jgi:hypothetical protein
MSKAMVITIRRGATKKSIKNLLVRIAKEVKPLGINTHKYVGKISLKKDALTVQNELRNEWE